MNVTASRRVVVLARPPVLGRVKTRLVPALGFGGATRLYRAMLSGSVATARAAAADVELRVSEPFRHPWVMDLCRTAGLRCARQSGGDLGRRMADAFAAHLHDAGPVVLIGADCPALSAEHIGTAFSALAGGCQAAFVPATDGGYVLIGLRRFHPALFRNIAWSGDGVMAQTRGRLRGLDWRWHEQAPLPDIDEPGDLHGERVERLRLAWRLPSGHVAPRSRAGRQRAAHG